MQNLNKLLDPDYINMLLEQYSEKNITIELKTCQDLIETGSSDYPVRLGRFTLDKEKHDELLNKNGFYLFLVKNNGNIIKGKLVAAEDFTFTKQLNWKSVVNSG